MTLVCGVIFGVANLEIIEMLLPPHVRQVTVWNGGKDYSY
jgi:hypothetical protein